MKKKLVIFLTLLTSASVALAGTTSINNLQGGYQWTLNRDSSYDLVNTKIPSPMNVKISVNSYIFKDGTPLNADQVTVDCDGIVFIITSGLSQTCKLIPQHHAKVFIAETDYHNGATGDFNITFGTTH